MLLVLIGMVLGAVGAFASARLLQHVLYQIGSQDALTYSIALFSLGVVAFLSSLLPALKATKIDPIICLRLE